MPGHRKKESQVYRQLAGSGLTAGNQGNASFSKNIDLIQGGLVLQEDNDQNFHDLNTVNKASFRTGNDFIPGTLQFVTADFIDNGTETILTPKSGEVWRIIMPIAKTISGSMSTTVTYQYFLKNESDSTTYRIGYYSSTSSSPILNEDESFDGEFIEIGHGASLVCTIGSFSGTLIRFGVYAGRIK